MSDERRRLVIYEQTDGSFRIPPDVAHHMVPSLQAIQLDEPRHISHPFHKKLDHQENVALLRAENQLYKKKYLNCMKQFGELLELNQLITRKLDLAIHNAELGIEIESTPSAVQVSFGVDRAHYMNMDPPHAAIHETASTSGRGSKGTKPEHSSKLFPPKKRLWQ